MDSHCTVRGASAYVGRAMKTKLFALIVLLVVLLALVLWAPLLAR